MPPYYNVKEQARGERSLMRALSKSFVWVLLLLLLPALSAAKEELVEGKIMRVKDGDTVVVAPAEGGEFFVCRLYGIDAPEGKQSYGEESTRALKQLILGQSVEVRTKGRDQYGRKICFIRKGSLDVNNEMVRQGHAWAFRKYLNQPYTASYVSAEDEARLNKRGLWQQANPQPPWEFRSAARAK